MAKILKATPALEQTISRRDASKGLRVSAWLGTLSADTLSISGAKLADQYLRATGEPVTRRYINKIKAQSKQ